MRARATREQSRGSGRFGVAAVGLVLIAARAGAEPSAALDLYRPADTPEGGFVLARPGERSHLAPAAQMHLEYASDPLVFEARRGSGESERVALVSDQATLHLGGSLGLFDHALVYAALPVHVSMRGAPLGTQPTATGAGFGDVAFGARVGIAASEHGGSSLQLTLTAPTAEGGRDGAPGVAGDEGMTAEPELLGEIGLGGVRFVGNFGLRWRKNVSLGGAELRDALTFGLGVIVPAGSDSLDLHVEAHGNTPVDEVGDRGATPAEALAGLKLRVEGGWSAGAAAGFGLSRGYGTPDVRLALTVGWVGAGAARTAPQPAPRVETAPEPPTALSGTVVIAPEPSLDPALGDDDGDGVRNLDDRCPTAPGEAGDAGCPLAEEESRPPPVEAPPAPAPAPTPPPAEPRTTAAVAAALAAAPGADDDGDGVWNGKDRCPLAPGQPARKGCPQSHDVDLEAGRLAFSKRIRFERAKSALDPRSEAWVRELAATLQANRTMKFRIEVHGPGGEDPAASLELTRARAAALRDALQGMGVPSDRAQAYGCGELGPVAPTRVPWGQKKNERIEVLLLDPSPSSGVASVSGCVRAQ